MEITGILAKDLGVQQVTENFRKREFVLYLPNEKKPEYSDFVKFELINDFGSQLDNIKVRDTITVKFDIKGREYTKDGKTSYFNSLRAYRILPNGQTNTIPAGGYNVQPTGTTKDDLPF